MKRSKKYLCPLLGLIQYLPEVHKVTLDRCITTAQCDPQSEDYWIKYNYAPLQAPIEVIINLRKDKQFAPLLSEIKPLMAVNVCCLQPIKINQSINVAENGGTPTS